MYIGQYALSHSINFYDPNKWYYSTLSFQDTSSWFSVFEKLIILPWIYISSELKFPRSESSVTRIQKPPSVDSVDVLVEVYLKIFCSCYCSRKICSFLLSPNHPFSFRLRSLIRAAPEYVNEISVVIKYFFISIRLYLFKMCSASLFADT